MTGLVEAAKLEEVQGAEDGQEAEDDADGDHGDTFCRILAHRLAGRALPSKAFRNEVRSAIFRAYLCDGT